MSAESRPIKVANTAPSNNTRANEIAIETSKTSKVSAVVAVMSIFCKKNQEQEAFSPKGGKCQFPREKFLQVKKLFSKNEKRPVAKEIIA